MAQLPNQPRCTIIKDAKDGSLCWVVEADKATKDTTPPIAIWWNREPRKKIGGRAVVNEHLIIRQENGRTGADVLVLTHGQAYDLIDALNRAVESK